MKKRVYIETTIPSYLAAWPARDLLQAARQRITHDWWNSARSDYELFVSAVVLEEATAGDVRAAARRKSYIESIPVLDVTDEAIDIANAIL